jgi:hypothetical protein
MPGRGCATAHLEHAADQRRGVHRAPAPGAHAAGRACAARGARTKKPRCGACFHQPLRLQQVVGTDHGRRAHAVRPAQSRTDGSRAPGRQQALLDALGKALGQLFGQGRAARASGDAGSGS